MAVRTDAQEERIATLRSVMNVIALLDGEGARRGTLPEAVDLRALLPLTVDQDSEDPWFSYLARPRPGN
jgi:hypothetical protein